MRLVASLASPASLASLASLACLIGTTSTLTSCTANRARKVEMDHRDIEMTPKGSFVRGTGDEVEELDEQEFYALVGDQEAYDKIHGERSSGELMQPGGLALATVGAVVGVAGLGILYGINQEPPLRILGDDDITLAYGLAAAGALGALGGGYLFVDGAEKAAGEKRMFDNDYALAALEKARYGTGGATPSTIARLELATESGAATYCSVSGVVFAPLKAFDDKGRPVKLHPERTEAWFVWQSLPEGTLGGTNDWVSSPTTTSLADIGKDIVVTVKVASETNVSTVLQLKPDYGCRSPSFDFAGAPGFEGKPGKTGTSGDDGATGATGGTGGTGEDGARGNDVDVEMAALRGPLGEDLVLAVLSERESTVPTLAVFDPAVAGPLVINANGGRGGRGGSGGRGGQGGDHSNDDTCATGGTGGSGGSGGNGARGGDGGTVRVRADSKAALDAIAARADGGGGGPAGARGKGGNGGDGDSCPGGSRTSGADGTDGVEGNDGEPGRPGKVEVSVVPRPSLQRLQEALASMPAAEAAPAPSEPPPSGKPPKKKPKKK